MEKISFTTNVPVELRLAFLEGKRVPSNFGGDQYLFSTIDGRSFYVSEAVGNILHDQIRSLNIRKGESIEIMKTEVDGGRGRKSIRWQVNKVGVAIGEQPDGTFAVDTAANGNGRNGAGAGTPAPANGSPYGKPTGNGNGSSNGTDLRIDPKGYLLTGPGQALLQAGVASVDLAVALERYAAENNYSLRFSSEDIRAILLSIFIHFSRNGGGTQ